MGHYKNLLMAYDGSDSSKNALRQAIALAREDKVSLTVLTVIPPLTEGMDFGTLEKIEVVFEESAKRLISEARGIASAEGYPISEKIAIGAVFEQIIDAANTGGHDLIVMGRRGLKRLERMLMGSVTRRVVCQSPVDVLVVQRDSKVKFGNILLATDGSDCSEAAKARAFEYAKLKGGKIDVVGIVESNDEFYADAPGVVDAIEKQIENVLSDVQTQGAAKGIPIQAHMRSGVPHHEIVMAAKELSSDVIMMGTHGRRGIARLIMGSVTEKVIGHSDVPVLVAKSP